MEPVMVTKLFPTSIDPKGPSGCCEEANTVEAIVVELITASAPPLSTRVVDGFPSWDWLSICKRPPVCTSKRPILMELVLPTKLTVELLMVMVWLEIMVGIFTAD